jgi:hypothetical protein
LGSVVYPIAITASDEDVKCANVFEIERDGRILPKRKKDEKRDIEGDREENK